MAADRRGRPVDGILLLDKPAGVTSNAALQRARRLLSARKGGHTGTLDPFATGLLPLCFGEATKFGMGLLEADKVYRAEARVGAATDTGDRDGAVTREEAVPVPPAPALEAVLDGFRGEIDQVPPMYSACKHQGQRLYRLARAGQAVERAARRVTIRELRLEGRSDEGFTLFVRCSSGTYVRVLVEDIAARFDAPAHTTALRRLAVGPLELGGAVTLEALEEAAPAARLARLLPIDAALAGLPTVELDPSAERAFLQGRPGALRDGTAAPGSRVRVYGSDRFLGVADLDPSRQAVPRRVVATDGANHP